jgi:hypothetical protein
MMAETGKRFKKSKRELMFHQKKIKKCKNHVDCVVTSDYVAAKKHIQYVVVC